MRGSKMNKNSQPPQLKIRLYGDPCLRRKSAPVKDVGPAERMLIEAMLKTMYENKGIGLAAPQVGVNQQIFVYDVGDGPEAIINPKIIKKWGAVTMEEGCLSIPGVVVDVRRPEEILLRYLNADNQVVEKECVELVARVVQHETDHLNGKLIVDHAKLGEKLKLREKLKEINEESAPKESQS